MLSDEALVEKAKSGDKQAFKELMRRYRDPVYFTIMHISKNTQDVEDIFQEVFIVAFRNIEHFDPNKAHFKTWLFSIVKNRCIDAPWRSKARLILMQEFIDEMSASRKQDAEDGFAAIEAEQILKGALINLSEGQRLCLTFKIIGGLSYEEIAKIAKVPVETIKSRISSARKSIARQILHPRGRNASCNVIK